jgi:DNA-binding transcriptional LysR family regulator
MAAGPMAREAIVPALLHELDERFPSLLVEVAEEDSNAIVEGVLHGRSDIGLLVSPPAHEDMDSKLLRRDRPIAVVHPTHPLATSASVTVSRLAKHILILWPRKSDKGSHDLVLGMFHDHRPASTRIAPLSSGAFWDALLAGGFAIVAASAPVSGDLVGLPIDDAKPEFSMSMIWSRQTPPALLAGLIDAADSAIAANKWLP